MSRSFVVGKRKRRVVFGRFCDQAVAIAVETIVVKRGKKRESMFIGNKNEVSKVPLNPSDATAISF